MRDALTQGWPEGVIGATDASQLPPTASPRALNSVLAMAGGGVPLAAKRKGCSTVNTTAISGATPIIGGHHFYKISTGTHYHVLVSRGGRCDVRASDNSLSTISTSLTSGDHYPDFAIASDLCFLVNGQDRLKFNGTSLTNFGITRPTVATMAGAPGGAGLHNGTYELRVTFANSATGHESSASDTAAATVTVSNAEIDWSNVPVSADTQVTHRYLYARNTATQTQFFRVGTIADNTTTTATTSILDANATTPAPTTTGRNRPPSGTRYLAFHQGRLFAATSTALHWSRIEDPEAFDDLAFDGINASDGQRITGLVSTDEILLVFKEDRVYGIFNGNDPNTWQIRLIDDDYGCTSHRSIVVMDGITFWWSRHGLCGWQGGQITNFSDRYGLPVADTYNLAELARVSATKDEVNNRLLVAVPSTGSTTANRLIPFSTLLQRFEASYWDPMDAASLSTSFDSSGVPRVYLGNYGGQLFLLDSGHRDGVPSGDIEGTWVASGPSVSSFTALLDNDGNAAALYTTGTKLVNRKFQLFDSSGALVGDRRTITANTADTVTIDAAIGGLQTGQTYIWRVGNIDWQWDTPWVGDYTTKKRYEFLTVQAKGIGYGSAMRCDLNFDYHDIGGHAQRTITTDGAGSEWDEALWDVNVFDSADSIRSRHRIGRVGFVWRARFRNSSGDAPCALVRIAVDGVVQTGKR